MSSLYRQNASKLFLIVLGTCLASLVLVAALSVSTVTKVKIGSELHDQIIEGKDLIADVLPPPAFILESYQVAGRMLNAPADEQEQLAKTLARLQTEYDDRLKFWAAEKVIHQDDPALVKIFTHSWRTRRSQFRNSSWLPMKNSCQL